ncbi:MAG: hypothetical protein AAF889_08365 [Cyanobacteria bacterium P01_D01_bin.73]
MLHRKSNKETPPILLSWTVMTAIAAAIFGSVVFYLVEPTEGADGILRLIVGVFGGGLIVGCLEWGTLRAYRIPISPLWFVLQPVWMLMLLIAMFIVSGTNEKLINSIIWWGLALEVPRWWLLRSHFRNAKWWTLFCGLGWLIDTPILAWVGAHTIGAASDLSIALVAFNGFVNGAWMGFCRGVALTIMLRDRRRQAPKNVAPTASFQSNSNL